MGFGDEKACDSGEGGTGVLEIETGESKGKEKVEGGVESAMSTGVEPVVTEREMDGVGVGKRRFRRAA